MRLNAKESLTRIAQTAISGPQVFGRERSRQKNQAGQTRLRRLSSCRLLLLLLILPLAQAQQTQTTNSTIALAAFKRSVVDEHQQLYGMSCIPMSIEMVLKLLDRVPGSYYELQKAWKEKSDGNFSDFDGRTVAGVTFQKQFGYPRNSEFPLARLFATIHSELKAGRFVIVSLASSEASWHMYVIYAEDLEGDFLAVSKIGRKTIEATKIKEIITRMKGTDILTYATAPTHD